MQEERSRIGNFWYIVAAAGAGLGTGLAGLSAATVMVPILIVLCPSFDGQTGAYQATAIVLAADILGSAVTAATYAKNRHLDLRRAWIMPVCILSMSAVGSYAAFQVGNVVLGSFTLLLTFGIGIRFLVRPDTSKENAAPRGEKLNAKGIAVSIFFGLTIGFGTGFVGTGGGMMMLIVLTAFLGIPLATAVGTSTFILPCAAAAFVVRRFAHPPRFVFRKVLHLIAFSCTIFMLMTAKSWQAAALSPCIIAVALHPVLNALEKQKWFASLLVQKKPGEIKRSLLLLFFMFAVVTAAAWGVFDRPQAAVLALLMWGVGDAAAALIGIPFGRHKVQLALADGKKSWEGTAAMVTAACTAGLTMGLMYYRMPPGPGTAAIALSALVGAFTELVSPGEYDTATVPAAILIVLLLF